MLFNPKAVSFLLACSIAGITVAFLYLVEKSFLPLMIVGVLSFSSSFILTYMTFEFLIFREIQKVYASMDKITQRELRQFSHNTNQSNNPIRRINHEIIAYASKKEREIDELKKLEAYRKEFIANISHELKTPIFAAQGYILTLLDGAIDDEKVKYKFLKKAGKSLNNLDAVVQDLLTLSQIESGVISMKPEVFDLQSSVLDVYEQLESKAHKKGMKLKINEINEDGVYVDADPTRIMQVMINLVHNAIKYGRVNGWVEVGFKENGDLVDVWVQDNGHGISEEDLKRIFERFYRVDKSRSRKQGGTGLGLSIVKHILEGHDTHIAVESEIGKGTRFFFSLKRAD
ncbi:sensor histidine kinase [Flexithrix dorotheae]|uniref:sensor histidine kinase n=1 Tax=Flexithrix dorotheae TaxID=70993 RepID=UPI0003827865|nr:ATP-binding protein [Flexithrix dorotheae]